MAFNETVHAQIGDSSRSNGRLFDSDMQVWIEKEQGEAGAVSEIAVPKSSRPIVRSEMVWQSRD